MTSTERLLEMLSSASDKVSSDVELRDRLIRRLAHRGVSLRRISARAGLSHETVRAIVGGALASRPKTKSVRVD